MKENITSSVVGLVIALSIGVLVLSLNKPGTRHTVQVRDNNYNVLKSWQHCRFDPNASQYRTYTFWDHTGRKFQISAKNTVVIEED